MFYKRVTKYDPKNRDEKGRYLLEEWTDFSDIGKEYRGRRFDVQDYLQVEQAYVDCVEIFLERAGIEVMVINNFWISRDALPLSESFAGEEMLRKDDVEEGVTLGRLEILACVRHVLRNDFWCKLVNDKGVFIHFGYDFYMYFGCDYIEKDVDIHRAGMHVEEFVSPYLFEDEDDDE